MRLRRLRVPGLHQREGLGFLNNRLKNPANRPGLATVSACVRWGGVFWPRRTSARMFTLLPNADVLTAGFPSIKERCTAS